MCSAICVLIVVGAVLFVCAQGMQTKLGPDPDVKKAPGADETQRLAMGIMWCMNLSYLCGALAILLILCCLCCRDVEFKGAKGAY